jgi:transketolase
MPDAEASAAGARQLARQIRLHALAMTSAAGSSHIGSVFSCADIVATLYAGALRVDPARPDWPERDRFLLSKGHAGAAIYAALAERNFFPTGRLRSYYQDGSQLSGHVSHDGVPGVEFSTGSLGHALPVAAGMAYAARLDQRHHRVVTLMSDGECDEGTTWEAALFAAHHQLQQLTVILDYNKIQSLAPVAETLALEPLAAKWTSFGWAVAEVDGHDHAALQSLFARLPLRPPAPSCIIAHTTKGKGVSFMENSVLWHYRAARGQEYEAARAELEAQP